MMKVRQLMPALIAAALVSVCTCSASAAAGHGKGNPGVLPVTSNPYGKSYGEWSAAFWQWLIETPWDSNPSNPEVGTDAITSQSSRVWFLATPEHEVHIDIPAGTALFFPMMNVECSSLEPEESGFHGDTEAEQAECAKFWADHIVNPVCIVDGKPAQVYRVVSPQFEFNAPSPWIFGATGGEGTAVGDGYYVMLAPLSVGQHTIEVRATLHFEAGELGPDPVDALTTDVIWHVNVVPGRR